MAPRTELILAMQAGVFELLPGVGVLTDGELEPACQVAARVCYKLEPMAEPWKRQRWAIRALQDRMRPEQLQLAQELLAEFDAREQRRAEEARKAAEMEAAVASGGGCVVC